jgi:hypothetical protein
MRFNRDAFVEILDRSNYPSRKDFALRVGISPGTLTDVTGSEKEPRPRRQPSDDLIRRFAVELKVPLTAIINAPAEHQDAA